MPEKLFKSHEDVFKRYSDKCKTFTRTAENLSGSPFAVISDIHGNLPALDAVLKHLKTSASKYGVSNIICLGDIVGYGPKPKECLELVKELNPKIWVQGNHDHQVYIDDDLSNYSPEAAEQILWTKSKLSNEDREFLGNLPFNAVYNGNIFIAHAKYGETRNVCIEDYLADANLIAQTMVHFSFSKLSLGIFGHTHQQWIANKGIHTYRPNDYLQSYQGFITISMRHTPINKSSEFSYKLDKGIHFLNPGSVGQPRDFEPAAGYAIVIPPDEIILFRIPYDISETAKQIDESDINPEIAKTLIKRLKGGF